MTLSHDLPQPPTLRSMNSKRAYTDVDGGSSWSGTPSTTDEYAIALPHSRAASDFQIHTARHRLGRHSSSRSQSRSLSNYAYKRRKISSCSQDINRERENRELLTGSLGDVEMSDDVPFPAETISGTQDSFRPVDPRQDVQSLRQEGVHTIQALVANTLFGDHDPLFTTQEDDSLKQTVHVDAEEATCAGAPFRDTPVNTHSGQKDGPISSRNTRIEMPQSFGAFTTQCHPIEDATSTTYAEKEKPKASTSIEEGNGERPITETALLNYPTHTIEATDSDAPSFGVQLEVSPVIEVEEDCHSRNSSNAKVDDYHVLDWALS